MYKRLSEVADVYYGKSPSPVIDQDGEVPVIGTGGRYATAKKSLFDVGIVVPRKGSLGNPQLLTTPFWPSDTTYAVIPTAQIDPIWLYFSLLMFDLTRLNEATGVPSINRAWLCKLKVYDPGVSRQGKIGQILQTVDQAIEHTSALIKKYQQIKAGLMHDLFTRGIGADGKLRPPREQAPDLYQETPIGWIPQEWHLEFVSNVLDSVVDGPFGSNLKTEHYVVDPGVRVVRLQNVTEYEYNDDDKAFVSATHASSLGRNLVIKNDVLIAGLGEERYPVGRSCIYPEDLPPAINKADCFRARCINHVMENKFFMLFLNSQTARQQIRRYEQGVTRPRINTGNLKRLQVVVPAVDEQLACIKKFEAISEQIIAERNALRILTAQKSGLMHDLLTGKVHVTLSGATMDDSNV